METYEVTIRPESGFATPLKGDTLFGHLCWRLAVRRDADLGALIASYDTRPFAVMSSPYVLTQSKKGGRQRFFKKPDAPYALLEKKSGEGRDEKIRNRKTLAVRSWFCIEDESRLPPLQSIEYVELKDQWKISRPQAHNTLSRITGTTGTGEFAPYTVDEDVHRPELELGLICLVDKSRLPEDLLRNCLEEIGKLGYGKDASTGKGRFLVKDMKKIDLAGWGAPNANACYTLAPCVPRENECARSHFTPFVSFGRHGDALAGSENPFKNPIVMADEGALFIPESGDRLKEKHYIGRAITGISKSLPQTVAQGYAPFIPVYVEEEKSDV